MKKRLFALVIAFALLMSLPGVAEETVDDDFYCSREELPFELPEIHCLEGYELTAEYYHTYDYEDTDEGFAELYYMDAAENGYYLMIDNSTGTETVYVLRDGLLTEAEIVDGPAVLVSGNPAYRYNWSVGGLNFSLEDYFGALTAEQIGEIIAGTMGK